MAKTALSRIEPHEEQTAEALIRDKWNEWTKNSNDMPTPLGFNILLQIYLRPEELKKVTRPDGSEQIIWAPQSVQTEDKYNSSGALVLALGPDAYKGERFNEPWCKPGDWVLIPRQEGQPFLYRGVACILLADDKVQCVIGGPEHLARINAGDRV